LFEIDEKAVADAVSFDLKPKEVNYPVTTPPPPTPTAKTEIAVPSSNVGDTSDESDFPLAAIAGGLFAAFAAATFLMRGRGDESATGTTTAPATMATTVASPPPAPSPPSPASPLSSTDVSIPYDAAARLAYDEWRAAHNKGDFDEAKFFNFKAKYLAVTSDNMAAKKVARDTGTEPELQVLSPTADE
jgi:hypothetical protein